MKKQQHHKRLVEAIAVSAIGGFDDEVGAFGEARKLKDQRRAQTLLHGINLPDGGVELTIDTDRRVLVARRDTLDGRVTGSMLFRDLSRQGRLLDSPKDRGHPSFASS